MRPELTRRELRKTCGRVALGAGLLAALVGVPAKDAGAAVIVSTETAAWSNLPVAVDAGLSTKISSTDLLEGNTPTGSLSLIGGTYGELSDGTGGEWDFDPDGRVVGGPISATTGTWTITFSGLGGVDLLETHVFSWNSDGRSKQDYEVLFSTNGGGSFSSLITDVIFSPVAATNLTIVEDDAGAAIASGVTDLRFVFSDVFITTHSGHTSLVEIDAFAVPEPGAAILLGCGLLALTARGRRKPA